MQQRLKEADASVGQYQRNVGNYEQAITNAYQKLQVEYSKAAQKAKDLAIAQGAGSEAAKKAAAAAYEIQQRLKEADASVGQYQLNVGNYEQAITNALGPAGAFIQIMQNTIQAAGGVKNAMTGAIGGVKSFALQIMKPPMILIVGVIAAIVAVFAALKKGIETNGEATRGLQQVVAPFKLLMEKFFVVLGDIANVIIKGALALGNFASKIMSVIPGLKNMNAEAQRAVDLEKEKQSLLRQGIVDKAYDAKEELRIAELKKKIRQKELYSDQERLAFAREIDRAEKAMALDDANRANENLKMFLRDMKLKGKWQKDYTVEELQQLTDLQAAKYQEQQKYFDRTIKSASVAAQLQIEIDKDNEEANKKAFEQRKARLEEERKARENMIVELKGQVKTFNIEMDKLNAIVQQQIGKDFDNLKKQLNETIPVLKQNFENYLSDKLDIARLSGQGEADAQLEIMRWQMQQELSVKDLTEQQKLAITEKYKLQEQKLNETIIMNNVSMLGSALGDISGLLEEGSKEQKAISSAQVAVDTITAAFAAFKSGVASGLPTPFNFIAGGTLAAIASAKGAKAIKDIWAVDEKGTTSAPTQTATAIPDLTSKMSSPLNRGVSGVAAMGGANVITSAPSTGSTLLNYDAMANAMTSAMSKMPAPVVSVVELNKKSNNVKFIENISTYSRK